MATSGRVLPVHGNEDPRLFGQDEVVRARVVHQPLPGVHREHGYIDVLALQGLQRVVEILFGGFDLPQSAFLPASAEIQVARVENAQPVGLHQKGHAQIGGLIGLDPDVLRQLFFLQGSQPFADGADGHIAGNDVGNGQPFLGPRVYHGSDGRGERG